MALDKDVMRTICRAAGMGGHSIVSLRVEEAITPKGEVVAKYAVLCTQCGGTLDEIGAELRALRGVKTRSRRPKGEDAPNPALSSPPPPISDELAGEL